MRRALRVAWLVALALACTRARAPGAPAPLAVSPARATADAPVRVEIAGRDFDARVRADFNSTGAGEVDGEFEVRLEPAGAGSAVTLGEVALTDRRTLLATVPAGLAPGRYRLVVVDPRGRSGALEHAYEVIASATAVARFDVALGERPRAGIAFPVVVTALDANGAVVEGFDGTVTLSDTAGALPPRRHGPFTRGRGHGKLKIPRLVESDALTVRDEAGHVGTSAPFAVAGGPPTALVFASAPAAVRAGRCSPAVELALRDGTGTATVAEVDVEVALQSAPPGVEAFSNAGCTQPVSRVTVGAGDGGAAFHFRAPGAAGVVVLRAVPAALPSAVQSEVVTP